MARPDAYIKTLLNNLKLIREKANLSTQELEDRLILGPGWINRFETGETIPTLDMMITILNHTGSCLSDLLDGLPKSQGNVNVDRQLFAEQSGNDLIIRFRYAKYDAEYILHKAKKEEFEEVEKTLRDGLAKLSNDNSGLSKAIKTDSVANAFLKAVQLWPNANPSDLWWFLIYRAYCDPYNHPAQFARLNLDQSWKRTAGWALEEVVVRHYRDFLNKKGIHILIADDATKQRAIKSFNIDDRLEADKIDVLLAGDKKGKKDFYGVIHVKASFAERRTDDVPMSKALIRSGYTSPFWTMDCKSMPHDKPTNRGELGEVSGKRSAKRKDIEDEGYFSGCFSYNKNTKPSPEKLPSERRIHVCDFRNANDAFSKFIISRWQKYRSA